MCYTYLIKCTINNKFYYGVRWGNKVPPSEDLWFKYFTSSKVIKNLINQYGKEAFLFEVRKVFTTKQEALAWEETVLRRLKVLKSPDIWLNKCISKAIRYDIHPRKGVIVSEETKEKISKSNKGKPKFTEEDKLNMSINRTGSKHWNYGNKWSEESKNKNKLSNQKTRKENPELFTNPPSWEGKNHSDQSKEKMSLARKLYWEKKRNSSPN
jgi:hypothetical protein